MKKTPSFLTVAFIIGGFFLSLEKVEAQLVPKPLPPLLGLGVDNTALSLGALYLNLFGSANTALGFYAGYNNTNSFNTFVGDSAGYNNTKGRYNSYLGYESGISNKSLSNQIYLGDSVGAAAPIAIKFAGALEPYYSSNYQAGTSGLVLTSQGAGVAPQWVSTSATAWSLTGNSGTSPAHNFLGTTDTATLVFKVNGTQSGWIDAGKYLNTFLGYKSGGRIISAYNSTGIGFKALEFNTTGIANTAIGVNALAFNTTGSSNTVLGANAGIIQGGSQNVFIGDSTGFDNPGNGNTYVGYEANRNSTFGYYSNATAIGYEAHTSASNQVVLGNTSVTSFVFNGDLEAGVGNYGTSGQVLVSQGAGAAPLWSSAVGTNYLNDTVGGSGTTTTLATATNAWSTTGNAGTSPATNFLGTTDTATLIFKVHNVQAGWIDIEKYRNSFFGYGAGTANLTGYNNTGIGSEAIALNTSGVYNTGIGSNALRYSVAGSDNTVLGANAGVAQDGSQNVLIGDSTGFDNPGSQNTFVGYEANRNSSLFSYSNATAIGYHAIVSANNSAVIGNTSVTSIGGYASWSNISDSRYKKNIETGVHGLDFILKLKPVVYNVDVHKLNSALGITNENEQAIQEKEAINYSGFLAQDVEQAANDVNYDFSGVIKPQNESDHYRIAYSDFVVPLVKSVQELNAKNADLNTTIDSLRNAFKNIQNCLTELCVNAQNQKNTGDGNVNINVQDVSLSSANAPVLYQNNPNPFSAGGAKINYYLPEGAIGATIVFYDSFGNQIKQVQLSQTGNGTLNVTPDNLSNGIYSYSLIVNGNVVDTKRMVLQK